MGDAAQNNLPIDAMPKFMENAWDTIRNKKEFNLPDQRAMVANYRCNEIKEESMKEIEWDVAKLEGESAKGVVPNFGAECTAIMAKATNFFNDAAKQYAKDIRDKIEKDLVDQATQQFFLSFDSQLKMLGQTAQ